MFDIEKAIEIGRKYSGYAGEIKDFVDAALIALQEKTERDKMRCENCKYISKDEFLSCGYHVCENSNGIAHMSTLCRLNFCSDFEPKEDTT